MRTAFDLSDPATVLHLPPDRTFRTTSEHIKVIGKRVSVGVKEQGDWLVVAVDADTPDAVWWIARKPAAYVAEAVPANGAA